MLCGDFTQRDISLCKACEDNLPRICHACEQCGIPLDKAAVSNALCGQCIQTSPAVDYTISLFHYENPVSYLIGQMKFQQQLSSAAIFANLLCTKMLDTYSGASMSAMPEALLPVPLHKTRLAKRGFNQSLEISRDVAKAMTIPVVINKVERVKNTDAQTHLNKQQRMKNVKGCFNVVGQSFAKHVVIVDDVITTGATTNELARILKTKGVEKVGVWSIARADI